MGLSPLQTAVSRTERFIKELRRRHVFTITVGWIAFVFAWLQLAQPVYPILGLADWAYSATFWVLIGLTPVVLVLAWVYDITSEGIKRTTALTATSSATAVLPPPTFSPRSIAILPFANMTADSDNEYFSDGITEDIIARACRMRDVKVISRTSVMQYKGTQKSLRTIGRELGVATILEGSVRRSGDRVRIVAQLVDARTDSHKWAETYDRVLDDIFRIQTDVANQIAAALQANLSPEQEAMVANQPTEVLEAYDLYLRARHEWLQRSPGSMERSVELLKQAIALDPKFALAHAALADSYVTLGVYGARPPLSIMPAARLAAEEALRLDATLPEALTALAAYHALHDWDFASARRAFEAAMEMSPQYATAPQWMAMELCVPLGQFAEAEKLMARAAELDPLSPVIGISMAVLAYYKRDYELTIDLCDDVLTTHPHFGFASYFRGLALLELRRLPEAIAALASNESIESRAWLAAAHALNGDTGRARALIAELEAHAGYVSPALLSIPYLALNEHEHALALLQRAREERAVDLLWIGVRPVFDPLRGDPRFQRLQP